MAMTACGSTSQSSNIQALEESARQAADGGDPSACIARYTEVLNLQPDVVDAYTGRAGCYLDRGNAAAAVHDYDKAIELSPGDPSLFLQRANAEREIGNRTATVADYKRIGSMPSAGPELLVQAGEGLASLGFYNDALSVLDVGITEYGSSWDLYRVRANVEGALGFDQKASADFQKASSLAVGASLAKVLADRGRLYEQRQQYKLAIDDYTHALTLDSSEYQFYQGRGEGRQALGDLSGAEKDFGAAIQHYGSRSPSDPDVLADLFIQRGRLYMQEGLREKARADFTQALQISRPSNASQRSVIQRLLTLVNG
jgi:tetratricopeptide (TPR) repeat protein